MELQEQEMVCAKKLAAPLMENTLPLIILHLRCAEYAILLVLPVIQLVLINA